MGKDLTSEQKHILFEEGTEPPGTSQLNYEKRQGSYHCVGCGTKLFESNTKYESGSGWPSFFQALPNVFETKINTLIGSNRSGIFLHLMPIFSTVLAILIFKEKFMFFHLVGAIFIITGIILSSKKINYE